MQKNLKAINRAHHIGKSIVNQQKYGLCRTNTNQIIDLYNIDNRKSFESSKDDKEYNIGIFFRSLNQNQQNYKKCKLLRNNLWFTSI